MKYVDIKEDYKQYLERLNDIGNGLSTQRLILELFRIENKNKPVII